MLRCGLSTNDSCDCHAEQTADHITSGRCPIYRPLEGINGILDQDGETRAWLQNNTLDLLVVCDGTHKKKKLHASFDLRGSPHYGCLCTIDAQELEVPLEHHIFAEYSTVNHGTLACALLG